MIGYVYLRQDADPAQSRPNIGPPCIVNVPSDTSQKITTPDGKVVEKHLKAGQVFRSESVTHSIVYAGKNEGHILAFELKK